jgi:hypothetical protein
MNQKKSFILHDDSRHVFNELSDEDAGKLIKELINYSTFINSEKLMKANKANALFGLLNVLAAPFKAQMDRDLEKWLETREARSSNGKLGGRPKGKKQKKANKAVSVNVNVNDNVTVKDNIKKIPPEKKDVMEYMHQKKITSFQVDDFMDYYESNGWLVGRNKMKDWKSTICRWDRNRMNEKPANDQHLF